MRTRCGNFLLRSSDFKAERVINCATIAQNGNPKKALFRGITQTGAARLARNYGPEFLRYLHVDSFYVHVFEHKLIGFVGFVGR